MDATDKPDVIAPVPLAAQRLAERGYNQAWQIARPLARALNVRSDATLLHRVIHTAPQSRLDLDARRLNVGRAFEVARPVQGLHVGIVDDVMTTGATLEALGAYAQSCRCAARHQLRRAAHTEKLVST